MSANKTPRIASIEPVGPLRARVTWADGDRKGRTDLVDLSPLVLSLKFYRPLRTDRDLFDTARVVRNGRAIEWGDGSIDMSAPSIEQLAHETMTCKDFAAFLSRNKLTQESAGAALGYSKRQIINFLKGTSEVPRVVALACHGFETARSKTQPKPQQLPDWTEAPFGMGAERYVFVIQAPHSAHSPWTGEPRRGAKSLATFSTCRLEQPFSS